MSDEMKPAMCESCGGMVDEDGLAMGSDVDELSDMTDIGNDGMPDDRAAGASVDMQKRGSSFADALKRRGVR